MPPSPASSFIPKRNPGNRPQTVRRYNFFLLPIISYALFMASLLGSAALFIYQISVNKHFNDAVTNLDTQITSFNDADLDRVVEFDDRLELSSKLLSTHVSIPTLLAIIENATANTVQFKNLNITRKNDTTLTVDGVLVTSALDGVLFQKSTFSANTLIASSSLTGVTINPAKATSESSAGGEETVTLKAEFTFLADKVLYTPIGTTPAAVEGTQTMDSVATTTVSSTTNQTTP